MTIFYQEELTPGTNTLAEDEAKHCTQVLRHQVGDEIMVFDGRGGKHLAVLTLASKKKCEFEIKKSEQAPRKSFHVHLAIAPTKNADRMEWLIEKLSEIGVDEVSLIQTKHSERKKLRLDRLQKKAISAMKQSGNPFLIQINELVSIEDFLTNCTTDIKLIAHMDATHTYVSKLIEPKKKISVLIGPEGDFSIEEVDKAITNGFKPVSLGQTTLRTETAGFVACCMVNTVNQY